MSEPSTVKVTVNLPIETIQAIRNASTAGSSFDAIQNLTTVSLPALLKAVKAVKDVKALPPTLAGVESADRNAIKQEQEPFAVVVKTLTGRTIPLTSVYTHTRFQDIKTMVRDIDGIALDRQRLIYQDQTRDDGDTLGKYKMSEGSVILLVLSPRGASKSRLRIQTSEGRMEQRVQGFTVLLHKWAVAGHQ